MGKQDILISSALFASLPAEQRAMLAEIALNRTYEKGEVLFFEGDPGAGFYVVAAGRVKIFKVGVGGREQILHIFGPGETFAEVPVFSGSLYPASAEAIESLETLYFPRSAFLDLIERCPDLAMNMLGELSLKLRRFARQIEDLSLKAIPERLAGYLLYLCKEQGRDDRVELQISKGQLASLLGTGAETLSRIFAKMSGEGLIEVKGRFISLKDLAGLKKRV